MASRTAPRRSAAARERRPRRDTRPRSRPWSGLGAWLQEHPRAALGSLGRLWRTPGASAMTVAVIAVAIALPGVFWLGLKNIQRAGAGLETGTRVSAYLDPALDAAAAERVADRIAAREGLRLARRISASEALAEFRSLAGFEGALAALQENPLPAVIVVEPAPGTPHSAAALEQLARELESIEGVDQARVDLQWVQRLHALLALTERAVMLLATLLAAGVLLIVGNTIRLDILGRHTEIEVMKLIGGSDAFIRRPFLYSGLWYGLLGAALACLALLAAGALLAEPVARLAAAYGSRFALHGLAPGEAGLLLGGGAVLGLVGSWLSVGRHLRAIEPG